MAHKGLNRETVIRAALEFVEEKGYMHFSMRALAEMLGVKTASLYNHISGIDELYVEIGLSALKLQKKTQLDAIEGKSRDEAVFDLADAYREFAKEHWELYKVIMGLPMTQNIVLQQAATQIIDPIMQVLSGYRLDEASKMHWQRVLRSIMHGFISQEEAGFFSHFNIEADESYHIAVRCYLEGLHEEEKRRFFD